MKKFKATLFVMFLSLMLVTTQKLYAYERITALSLLEPSTFDTLVLNYTTLPEVTVSGSEAYTMTDGTVGSGHPNRRVTYNNVNTGRSLDSTINVYFKNCGTLNGKSIDMRLIYSDMVSRSDGTPFLYWSAFGTTMTSNNEWWYQCIEHVKVDIYFYYSGESSPINLDRAYLSLFSEDNGEGASSTTATNQYIYNDTNMTYSTSVSSQYISRTYNNVYHGTADGNTEAGSLNCVAFRYNNTNHLEVELHALGGKNNVGYHFRYIPLTATVPSNPVKSVDKTKAYLGDTLTYTVNQMISRRYDNNFHYTSLSFNDQIDKNLTYNGITVYDENNQDITGSAGSASYNSSSRLVTYTFNQDYLNSMAYDGQVYKFVINTTVNNHLDTSNVNDSAYTVINNSYTLNSNTVTTEIKYKIDTYIDHGTITSSDHEVSYNSNKQIDFTPKSGYYISRIVVDGQDQSISNINGGSYTFSNVQANHSIQVYTTPKRIKINLSKEDKETGKTKDGDAVLSGAKYGIYRDDANCSDSSLIETLTTDANGNATSKEYNVVDGDTYHKYYLKEISPSTGYLIDSTVYTVSPDYTGQNTQSQDFSFTSKEQVIKNSISITKYLDKTDSTLKKKLNGVVFKATLNSDTSKVYYSTTTDSNGYCTISDLPYGTYTVVESTIPDTAFDGRFYVGATNVYSKAFTVSITEDKTVRGAYTYSDITNVPKKMRIIIYKEDIETGTTTQGDAHLENAEYTIYRDSNCTDSVETLTVQKNSDGTYSATSGWYLVGTYYVKETKAPEGYLIDKNVYEVKQVPSEQTSEYTTHTITSKDEVKKNDIDITKYLDKTDSTQKQYLAGAEFTAQIVNQSSPDKDKTYKATTDANGHCVIEDLPYGTYRVWESKVPDTAYNGEFYVNGATTRSTSFNQFIELDDTERGAYTYSDINDVPKKMRIIIYKEDIETGTTTQGDAHLENAEYTIYRDSNCTDEVETLTIAKNSDGTYSATSGWYLVGTYYVKETKAPEGYLIDKNVYEVKQVPSEQTSEYTTHTITSKDKVKRNDIDITKYLDKTDSTQKQYLAGAEFTAQIVNQSSPDKDKTYKATTDANGHCVIENMPYGTYRVWESKVPDTVYNGEFYVNGATTRSTSFNQFIELDDTERGAYTYSDINDVPKKMQITIYKEDIETGTHVQGDGHLEGAEYTTYRDSNCTDPVETLTIAKNEDGTYSATSGWYLVGTYYVKETKAPEGYLIDENVYEVKQVPAEQTDEYSSHSITSKDKVMKGLVHGIKYNNNSQSTDKSPAEGAKLRLTLDSNPSVYYDVVVNKDGYYDFIDIVDDTHYSSTENHYVEGDYPYTIPYGVYTISEVEASNSGENIFIDDQKTEIRYNRQEQYYILNDEYARIRPTIEIRDSETKKLIPGGATYKIWNVSKQEWYSEREYPSGKYITEFTTNDEGKLTVNGFLESGSYVIYETKAPYGYYLNDEMREGQKGYEFTLGVEKDGNVVAYHDGEKQVLEYTTQNYNNIPTKIYSYTADTYNDPQKAVIDIEKLASQFTKVEKAGEKNNLVFEEVGLKDVRFKLVATEDIITPEGTKRYSQGDVVSDNITDIEGLAKTNEVYLGKYRLEEVSTPNGYLSENSQIELNIEYTNQYERLQNIDEEIKNKKQEVKLEFEKVYKELEVSKFKFSNRSATFGIYTASALKNYKGETVIGKDELVDVMATDENSKLRNNVELPEGEYYVKEISVTSPYARKEDEYGFKVEYTNNTDEEVNVTVNDGKVENEASTAELELLVYPDFIWDEEGIDKITDRQELEELAKKYGIANKKYGVYLDEECTKQVEQIDGNKAEFETDENGIINIKDMPTGTYYFKETVSPYGYDMSDEVIKAEIKEGQKVVILKAKEPSKKAVLLRKYDTFTKDVISDVEFKITDEDEKEVYTSKTNEKGELEVPIILFEDGKKYYFEETSESKLYKVNKEKVEFTASIDEEKCEWTLDTIEVGNDRKTIDEVKIVKKDSKTDEPLQGCVFTIALLDENGNEYVNAQGETIYLVKEAVTGEDGTYSIENVPYGRYRFIEIKAPEGYEMDEDITGLEFSVDENSGDKIVFEVTNTGDIAVIALSVVAVVSVIGIVYVIVKNKKKNK